MRRRLAEVNWKAFALLMAAGLLGVVAVFPFALELLGSSIPQAPDVSMPTVLALALLQNGVLLAVAILIGMILSKRVGLRMPLIQAWTTGTRPSLAEARVLPALLAGAAVGAVLVAIEASVFLRHLSGAMHSLFAIPFWKRLLGAVVYGGITEELLMRLFLMALVAWLVGRWWMTPGGLPASRRLLDRHRARGCAFRAGTSPSDVSHHAADGDDRRARAGLERRRRHRVRLPVLEGRPRSRNDRAHECPRGDADSWGHRSDQDALSDPNDPPELACRRTRRPHQGTSLCAGGVARVGHRLYWSLSREGRFPVLPRICGFRLPRPRRVVLRLLLDDRERTLGPGADH